MGGNERERGRGRIISLGTVETSLVREFEREWDGDRVSTSSAGIFFEAAVEGLMSWVGSGWCFIEADWNALAISMAGLCAIVVQVRWK